MPSARRAELPPLVLDTVLPAALAWIVSVDQGPETSRAERRDWVAGLVDGELRTAERNR